MVVVELAATLATTVASAIVGLLIASASVAGVVVESEAVLVAIAGMTVVRASGSGVEATGNAGTNGDSPAYSEGFRAIDSAAISSNFRAGATTGGGVIAIGFATTASSSASLATRSSSCRGTSGGIARTTPSKRGDGLLMTALPHSSGSMRDEPNASTSARLTSSSCPASARGSKTE